MISSANQKPIKPFFCRVGTKRNLIDVLLPLIPLHKTYVEPFVGGGALFFAKTPSEKEIINDLDKMLIEGYRLLKQINNNDINEIHKLIEKFQKIKDKNDLLIQLNDFVETKSKNKGFRLYQILIQMCNAFSSTGTGKIYKARLQADKINIIDEYKNRLKNTAIFSSDYTNIINRFDNNDTFFFLDPPYEHSKSLYDNYKIDYHMMNSLLSGIKGKFLLTINSSPEIIEIFKNFNIKKIKVKAISGHSGIGGTVRNELIITNY